MTIVRVAEEKACAYLEVNIVRQEKKPGLCPSARAKAENSGHVVSAEGRIRHHNVMFRYFPLFYHLDKPPACVTTAIRTCTEKHTCEATTHDAAVCRHTRCQQRVLPLRRKQKFGFSLPAREKEREPLHPCKPTHYSTSVDRSGCTLLSWKPPRRPTFNALALCL